VKRTIILAILVLLLAGCGPVASPTHYEYDSHAVTTTTTTTAAAELAQENNRPVCVGLIVLGSCNTTATLTQTAAPAARPQPAGAEPFAAAPNLSDVVMWLLIAAMCSFLFCALIGGIKWIYRDDA
jgi:hypothetical protein